MKSSWLFGERANINDVVEAQKRSVDSVIDSVDTEDLRTRLIDEILTAVVHKLRLDVPVLHPDRTIQLPPDEIEIDVSRDPNRAIIPGRGPYLVKGTEVSIVVPFTGEAALFKYGHAPYPFINPIEGEVEDDHLILRHRAEHPDVARIKADFDGRLQQIDQVLSMIRSRAEEWNKEAERIARQKLLNRKEKLEKAGALSLGYPVAPRPAGPGPDTALAAARAPQHFDVFLSHASEDKDTIARPLYHALTAAGVSVWFDEAVLKLGDSLRRKIDEGLARCRYGIVVLSPSFFAKHWPQRELDGLVAKEITSGEKGILPIWHEIDHKGVAEYSPTLADRLAVPSSIGIDEIVRQIRDVLKR
jgi:hypothetical protein